MLRETTFAVPSAFGGAVDQRYIHHGNRSDTLAVILPGAYYTSDHPVLYYAREVALQSGVDTLSLRYAFQQTGEPYSEQFLPGLVTDALAAITSLSDAGYERIVLIAKSLGSLLVSPVEAKLPLPSRRFFLTPLPRALDTIRSAPCTVIAGAADHTLTPSFLLGLKNAPAVQLHIIADAGHSLEIHGDYARSLAALGDVCGQLQAFLMRP